MANIAAGLEKIVTVVGSAVNQAQKAIDKVLWGNVNESAAVPAPGTAPNPQPKKTKVGSFIQSGLYNAIDALLTVDLCAILDYFANQASGAKLKRKDNPTKAEKALYDLQDKAALVREAIDSFYAYPNEVLQSLKDPNPKGAPAPGTTPETNTPPPSQLSGSKMQKYNFGIVSRYISDIFKFTTNVTNSANAAVAGVNGIVGEGLLDPEVMGALSVIPGFKANINALTDFTSIADKYADFRQIPNEDFQKLVQKLDQTRAVCVTIENLSLGGAIDLAASFTGVDIRSQIAKLNQYVDPTKLIPTLSDISKALQSFNTTCRQIMAQLAILRGFVKIGLILIKVFRFIAKVIGSIPAPLQFATYSMVDKIRDSKDAVTQNTSGLERFLQQLNALLAVIIGVLRYVQQNTQELLTRVDTLINKLRGCTAINNSAVLGSLAAAQQGLQELKKEVDDILSQYDEKANKSNDEYGPFTIRIIEEELVDEGIIRKRRRGVAIDKNGFIAVQSDLTFATLNTVIIEEVKLKLVAAGLMKASQLTPTDLIIAEAMTYMNEAINTNDVDLPESVLESPDNQNQNSGLGLNGYLNQLKGTQALRRRVRAKTAATQAVVQQQARTIQPITGPQPTPAPRPNPTPTPTPGTTANTVPIPRYNYDVRVSQVLTNTTITHRLVKATTANEAVNITRDSIDPMDRNRYIYTPRRLSNQPV